MTTLAVFRFTSVGASRNRAARVGHAGVDQQDRGTVGHARQFAFEQGETVRRHRPARVPEGRIDEDLVVLPPRLGGQEVQLPGGVLHHEGVVPAHTDPDSVQAEILEHILGEPRPPHPRLPVPECGHDAAQIHEPLLLQSVHQNQHAQVG